MSAPKRKKRVLLSLSPREAKELETLLAGICDSQVLADLLYRLRDQIEATK